MSLLTLKLLLSQNNIFWVSAIAGIFLFSAFAPDISLAGNVYLYPSVKVGGAVRAMPVPKNFEDFSLQYGGNQTVGYVNNLINPAFFLKLEILSQRMIKDELTFFLEGGYVMWGLDGPQTQSATQFTNKIKPFVRQYHYPIILGFKKYLGEHIFFDFGGGFSYGLWKWGWNTKDILYGLVLQAETGLFSFLVGSYAITLETKYLYIYNLKEMSAVNNVILSRDYADIGILSILFSIGHISK